MARRINISRSRSREGLTFADIYQNKVERQLDISKMNPCPAPSGFSLGSYKNRAEDINFSFTAFKQDMANLASSLENDSSSALVKLKAIVSNLPKRYEGAFHQWVDHRGMDILQICIVFQRTEVILALLEEYNMFPESHTPVINPYAHLAAVLGFTECLEILLTHRPGFYFKTSKPQHAVKFHRDIQRRFKVSESGCSPNKNVQKLLRLVTGESLHAEKSLDDLAMAMQTLPDTDIFDKEILSLKKQNVTSVKSRRGKRRESFSPVTSFDTQVRFKNPTIAKIKPPSYKVQEIDEGPKRCLRQPTKRHLISVYMDYFDGDEPEGVVKGAGSRVKVIHANDVNNEPIRLPLMKDVRILTLESSKNMRQQIVGSTSFEDSSSSKTSPFSKSHLRFRDNSQSNFNVNRVGGGHLDHGLSRKIDFGVRTVKKYKDFQLKLSPRIAAFTDDKCLNKTPLTLAAQNGQVSCVRYLLKTFLLKDNPTYASHDPLTLATKVRSPESIAVLMSGKYSREDLQSAVLTALREFYPACLTVLLNNENKDRAHLFDGESLFHIFYGQSLNSNFRYEMMPEITKTLINCREDVNSRTPGGPHPLYTLITCAFHTEAGRQCLYYLECLKILLCARANPHYNEVRDDVKGPKPLLTISRQYYYSAIHCVFACAQRSTDFLVNPYWSKIIMRKFIDCIVVYDRTPRRILNEVLFCYMEHVCQLGLDIKILRSLFRYGANPDYKHEGKYAINTFFDEMLPFLTKFEVKTRIDLLMDALMFICNSMSLESLDDAFVTFLDEHLLHTPLQALTLTKRFCYEVNISLRSPRSLVRLTGQLIWRTLRRNNLMAKRLPIPEDLLIFIVP